jgi:hypothetical protein
MSQFKNISFIQNTALQLRFEENCTIFEISRRFGITWDEANLLIDSAVSELRKINLQWVAVR